MTLIFAGVMVPGERIKCLLQVICDRKILKFFILRGYLKVQSARGNLSGLPYRNIYFFDELWFVCSSNILAFALVTFSCL